MHKLASEEQLNREAERDWTTVKRAMENNTPHTEAAAEAFFRLARKYPQHAIKADVSTTESLVGKCGSCLHLAGIAGTTMLAWFWGYVPADEAAYTLVFAYQCHVLASHSDNISTRWGGTFGLLGTFILSEYRLVSSFMYGDK